MDPKKILREQFLHVVDNQLKAGDPPETAETLERLQSEGYSEYQAKELISACVAAEMMAVMESNRPFDQERFVAALKRLPELPEE